MTPAELTAILPRCPSEWAAALLPAMEKWQINTVPRQAAFLAQLAVENGELTQLTESFNYTPAALLATFPSYLTETHAQCYGRTADHPADQIAIANTVYANRYGNGDFNSGDGWRYRGRVFGLTFRANYRAAALALNQPLEVHPELCETPAIGCDVAGWFWTAHRLNALADANQFEQITKIVTGASTGLEQRQRYLDTALRVLT